MRRASLARQIATVTTVVAALAVLVAGLVALPLARDAALAQAQEALARQADVLADAADRGIGDLRDVRRVLGPRNALRSQQVDIVFVPPGGTLPPSLSVADAQALAATGRVDDVRQIQDRPSVVQARSLQGGGVLVLTQPVSTARAGVGESGFLTRLLIALLIGLALAVIAGLLLARRLGRPLQKASAAAHVLASGSRDVRLEPEGPAEVAELAESLNGLAEALDTSEGRQREFLLSVSHELRTPLTAVQGYAEALADGVVADDDVSATGTVMLAEARRLDRLVSDLLDLARTGARDLRLDVAALDAVDLVSDAGRVWSDRMAREDVQLSVRVPELPVPVVTDATRLRQIIDNLAENALRVSPSGSTMVFGLQREGGDAVIEVRDSGPGLTDDDLAVAFQPGALYERYRGVRRVGSGVGLALVDALARRLGGSVEAANADTGGAVFRVRVPARD